MVTRGKQTPWYSASLGKPSCFGSCRPKLTVAAPNRPQRSKRPQRPVRPQRPSLPYRTAIRQRQQDIPMACQTKALPHNALFTRRSKAFGTQLTVGIEKLINEGIMIGKENVRFDDFVALNTEDIPSPDVGDALAINYGIATIPEYQKRIKYKACSAGNATHYLEIALKTAEVAPEGHPKTKTPPVNYLFVVDVSGSMSGEKLDAVKIAIGELFNQLRADDVIGIIAFNHQAKTLLKSTPKQRISPQKFGNTISLLTADGDTNIDIALSISIDEMRTYQDSQRVNQLFLFSDGNPTIGETDWARKAAQTECIWQYPIINLCVWQRC